ncbi:MAG: universal stress protein [Terriglobales bacterium]
MEATIAERANALPTTHPQFRNILVGTNFSASSLKGLRVAIACAQKLSAALHIAHVVTPLSHAAGGGSPLAPPEGAVTRAREALREWVDRPLLTGVKHTETVLTGPLISELQRYVHDQRIDLVVVDGGTQEQEFMGSAAENIVQNLACPVAIAGPQAKPMLACRSILLATSLACPTSLRAAKYAVGLAEALDAHLTLMHIEAPGDHRRIDKAVRDSINRQLHNLLPPVCDCWCRPKVRFVVGDPASQILLSADKENADLIVMSALDADSILGEQSSASVLAKVVRGAKCPVMAVRTQPAVSAHFG